MAQLSKKAETIQTDLASAKSSLEKLKSAPYNSAKIEKEIDLTSIIGETRGWGEERSHKACTPPF